MDKKLYFHKLDAIRGVACLYVLIHNFVYGLYSSNLIPFPVKLLFAAGQEAVIVFFILSGFVVQLSALKHPQQPFRTFFLKRFRRIYFPLVIAMLVSLGVCYFNGSLASIFSWRDVAGNLILLQDFGSVKPGTWFYPFLGNLPLWSLSYEWWFYLLFYPINLLFGVQFKRIYYVLGFSAFSYFIYWLYPNQISLISAYFIIWWTGVEAATLYVKSRQLNFQAMRPIFVSLGVMLLVTGLPILGVEELRPGYYPILMFRHFLAALVAFAIGTYWYQKKLAHFEVILGWFSPLAPISYSLYVLSYPILIQWGLQSAFPDSWLVYFLNFGLLFALAYLVEIKLQPWVNRWIK